MLQNITKILLEQPKKVKKKNKHFPNNYIYFYKCENNLLKPLKK